MSIKKSFNSAKGTYKVTFTLPAEATNGSKNVVVLGDFNNWESAKALNMKAGKGDFSASVDLAPGTYEFRYLIDNLVWENDYQADNYVSSPFPGINNSVIFLPAEAKKAVVKKTTPAKATKVTGTPAVKKETPAAKTVKATTPATKTPKVSKPVAKVTKPVVKTEKAATPAVAAKKGSKAPATTKAKPAAVKATTAKK